MIKKWYLITGASSGIGYAVAKKILNQNECNVILIARSEGKLDALLKEYETSSFFLKVDLNELDEIEYIFKEIQKREIVLSGLIHCAGVSPLMEMQKLDTKTMIDTFNVNYFSFMLLMKYFSLSQYSYDKSRVVTISSITTKIKGRRQSIYAASKAALEHSVKYLSYELMKREININAISLGVVNTQMFENLCSESHQLLENTLKKQPLGLLSLETVSNCIFDLVSSESYGYTTGTVIELNGGYQY